MKTYWILSAALAATPIWARPQQAPFDYAVQIELSAAHSVTDGHADVKVAIISTGMNANLDEFRGALAINEAEAIHGSNGFDDDGNGYIDDILGFDTLQNVANTNDDSGLGAGTISASIIHRIAPKVKIIPIKAVSSYGAGTKEALFSAVNYAIAREADVLLIGLGGNIESTAICTSIERAARASIAVVVTAGNDGKDSISDLSPASCQEESMIVVTSSDAESKLASFSNYNAIDVDLAAPGVNIAAINSAGKPEVLSGGTVSSSITTGVVALAKSLKRTASALEIRSALMQGTDQFEALQGKVASGGRLNARKTLEALTP